MYGEITSSASESDSKKPSGVSLDSPPPPSSSIRAAKPAGQSPLPSNPSPSLPGPAGSDPQVIALKALMQIEEGVRTLAVYLPGLVPLLADLTGRLQSVLPQAMMSLGQSPLSMGMPPGAMGGPPMMGGMGMGMGSAPPGAVPTAAGGQGQPAAGNPIMALLAGLGGGGGLPPMPPGTPV